MKIQIKYFAALREQSGKSDEIIETEANSPEEIYSDLKKKYGFTLDTNELRVAINDNYENFNYQLKDHDTLVFIPPVAGG